MVTAIDPNELLASDAEREHAVERLNTAFSEGRLPEGEFGERVSRALAARTRADLATLLADLPTSDPVERQAPAKRPLAKRVAEALNSCGCWTPTRSSDRDGSATRIDAR